MLYISVASCTDRHLDITFFCKKIILDCRYRVVESSSIVSVNILSWLSHPNIFHLLSVLLMTPYLPYIGGQGEI